MVSYLDHLINNFTETLIGQTKKFAIKLKTLSSKKTINNKKIIITF